MRHPRRRHTTRCRRQVARSSPCAHTLGRRPTMARRVAVGWAVGAVLLAVAVSASAQTGSSGTSTGQSSTTTQTQSSSPAAAVETRPATTTFFGDTGLWFVPTGEVLPDGKWSVSAYRRGTDYIQGYTNVGDFAGTFAYGLRNKAEIFGSFIVDTRIDRDTRPIFILDPTFGGVVAGYPRVNQPWTGDNLGDLYIGAKYNFMSEWAPARSISRSMRSSARRSPRRPKSQATPDGSFSAARTISRRQAGRSAGAPASVFRRAVPCGSPVS